MKSHGVSFKRRPRNGFVEVLHLLIASAGRPGQIDDLYGLPLSTIGLLQARMTVHNLLRSRLLSFLLPRKSP